MTVIRDEGRPGQGPPGAGQPDEGQHGLRPPRGTRGLPRRVRVLRRLARELPPPRCGVRWAPGLEIPGADGVTLLADHYVPVTQEPRGTILVRTPYGRGFPWAHLYGVAFAEQGFDVLLQSCRGTGGSGGQFEWFRREAADGRAAVTWLRDQDWFTGRLGTIGASYLGYTQLALAGDSDPPPELAASVIQVGVHDPGAFMFPGGVFALVNVTSAVAASFSGQGLLRAVRKLARLTLRARRAFRVLPLPQACRQALGEGVPFIGEWLDHDDPADTYWRQSRLDLAHWKVPTALQGGWYDATLDQTLAQYQALRANGCDVSLLIGPWSHSSAFSRDGLVRTSRDALAWLTGRLAGDDQGRAGVRVWVGGADEWRELDAWPPADTTQRWYLNEGGELGRQAHGNGAASFRYDPADPTPSAGGQLMSPEAGPRDNAAIEARPDVLIYTSAPLADALDVLGPVRAEIGVRASTARAHVFARLCDVDPAGRSRNVTDGIIRLGPGQDTVTVLMSSTAYQFASGHRIRLQVSGGAFPRFARNTGTAEPAATATQLMPTDIEIRHDGTSALLLPAP
jgi:putative CocE/NonD family hydrolase